MFLFYYLMTIGHTEMHSILTPVRLPSIWFDIAYIAYILAANLLQLGMLTAVTVQNV